MNILARNRHKILRTDCARGGEAQVAECGLIEQSYDPDLVSEVHLPLRKAEWQRRLCCSIVLRPVLCVVCHREIYDTDILTKLEFKEVKSHEVCPDSWR